MNHMYICYACITTELYFCVGLEPRGLHRVDGESVLYQLYQRLLNEHLINSGGNSRPAEIVNRVPL